MYVQYGQVRVEVMDSDDSNKTVLNKTYSASKTPIVEKFKLKKNEDYEFLKYSRIVITALDESYFSFELISNEDPSKRGDVLKYGIPYYKFLDKNKEECISANVDRPQDTFLLSFDSIKDEEINALLISIKKEGKAVQFTKNVGIKELIITFPETQGLSTGVYSLCLKHPKVSCSVTIVQSSPVIYFPPNTPIPIYNELNLTFGSSGKNIIEVNRCQGDMIMGIYS